MQMHAVQVTEPAVRGFEEMATGVDLAQDVFARSARCSLSVEMVECTSANQGGPFGRPIAFQVLKERGKSTHWGFASS